MDAKKLLFDHFEKIALGVIGFLLIAYFGLAAIQGSPADENREKVTKLNATVREKILLAAGKVPPAPRPMQASRVEQALRAGPAGAVFPAWLFHKRPLLAVAVVGLTIPEPKHHEPLNVEGKGDLGRIVIAWESSDINHLVKVTGYEVYRKTGDAADARFEKVATIDGGHGKKEWIDTKVQPKAKYSYYVESIADVDEKLDTVKTHGITLDAKEKVKRSATIGPFGTKPEVYIQLINVTTKLTVEEIKAGVPEREPKAFLKVHKYSHEKKQWDSHTFSVKLGERVGEKDSEGTPTPDFVTDYVLEKTQQDKDIHMAIFRDTKTKEMVTITDQKNPELEDILKGPKKGGSEGSDERKEGEGSETSSNETASTPPVKREEGRAKRGEEGGFFGGR